MHYIQSLLGSDALSDFVELEKDKLKCHVHSLLKSDATSSSAISEPNVDVYGEFDDNSSLESDLEWSKNNNISMVTQELI